MCPEGQERATERRWARPDPERLDATCSSRQRNLLQGMASRSRWLLGAAFQMLRTWPISPAEPFGSSSFPERELGGKGRRRGQGRAKGVRHGECPVPSSSALHGWLWRWRLGWGQRPGLGWV